MKHLENRWFTKFGKAKRIPKDLEFFRDWAKIAWQENSSTIDMVAAARRNWNLSLADATNLVVYIVGCYSNATQYGHGHVNGYLYRAERYELGQIVAQSLNSKVFNIRKLELVK